MAEGLHTPALVDIDACARRYQTVGTDAPLYICDRLQGLHLEVHGLVGQRLQSRVDGAVHDQPIGINVVVVAVRPVDQPFTDLRGKMRGGAD